MSISTAYSADSLIADFQSTRKFTDRIADPLSPEDCMVQSMDDVSPARWHLAHTTWFFETFLLADEPDYEPFDPEFNYLFNSYYNSLGAQFPRARRGNISRPGLETIKGYRRFVDDAVVERLADVSFAEKVQSLLTVGLNHEQQHQELMLTDIKHVLSCNPLLPSYQDRPFADVFDATGQWIDISEGVYPIGHEGDGFAFDNESPRHKTFLHECSVARDLVTCGQYIEFMEDGGYERPDHWLSLGWDTVQQEKWSAPLYWLKQDGAWHQFTLAGLVPVNPDWPVCHVSLFEADAFARWSGNRLPTEFEWEVATRTTGEPRDYSTEEVFADQLMAQDLAIHPTSSPASMLGSVWQWTSSSYAPYPGYHPPAGAIGEYNGKFMCNQYVLRGGSVATSSNHIRPTYRNFFPAHARWQFSGIRLAK